MVDRNPRFESDDVDGERFFCRGCFISEFVDDGRKGLVVSGRKSVLVLYSRDSEWEEGCDIIGRVEGGVWVGIRVSVMITGGYLMFQDVPSQDEGLGFQAFVTS